MTIMVLSTLPGVGQRLAEKITEHFGGEQEAIASLKSGDIARIAEIDGVSPKRALNLARLITGQSGSFLATKEAEKLHKALLQDIVGFASCAATRERMQLLMPVENPTERRRKVSHAIDFGKKHSTEMRLLSELFQNLRQTRFANERYERVVVSKQPLDSFKKWCRVLQPGEGETWKDYTVFKTVTWIGEGAPNEIPDGWIVLPKEAKRGCSENKPSTVPQNNRTLSVVAYSERFEKWRNQHRFLESVFSVVGLEQLPRFGEYGRPRRLEIIAEVKIPLKDRQSLEQQVNEEVAKAMDDAKLNLSGALLEALSDGASFPKKLQEATNDVIAEAMEKAKQSLGETLNGTGVRCPYDIFASQWPAKINRKVIDDIDQSLEHKLKSGEVEQMVMLARKLGPLRTRCEEAVRALIELDQWVCISRWADERSCVMPEIVEHGIFVEQGRHLLLGGRPDPVTYGLGDAGSDGDQQSLVPLTGATEARQRS